MPEPIIDRAEGIDPEHEALLAHSVGLAQLVVETGMHGGCRRRCRALS